MFLPHITALIVDSKLSFIKIISDASLATLHPEPIAKPTSAAFNASTSLIPSPVTATFFSNSLSPTTKRCLS
jgi:hypothetical protein